MSTPTRLYVSGGCVALVLCATAVTFPDVPPTVMLGILGASFLALASRTHRHARAQHVGMDASTDRAPVAGHAGLTTSSIVYERRRDPAVTVP